MSDFVIKKNKKDEKCTTMTIRLEKELLAKYDDLANKYGTSRTDLVVQAMKFALKNLREEED